MNSKKPHFVKGSTKYLKSSKIYKEEKKFLQKQIDYNF